MHIEDFFEEQARRPGTGGAYAVAWAIAQLARQQKATAVALERLGNNDAAGPFGAIEGLAVMIKESAELVADAIGTLKPDD